ncbi:hypothetical protein F5X99DRAFT_407786 [Biscogniauxia marginata]|nr:hypothetical protein F5X99DRAFT_407786 [Biscogniauxia marginata]
MTEPKVSTQCLTLLLILLLSKLELSSVRPAICKARFRPSPYAQAASSNSSSPLGAIYDRCWATAQTRRQQRLVTQRLAKHDLAGIADSYRIDDLASYDLEIPGRELNLPVP